MFNHLRACFVLLVLTLIICCAVYPLTLWAAGRTLFPVRAEGSLVHGPDGAPIGSRLIAQSFSGDEYFQPRPSAASYNASASGASNFAASNYLLRDRIARTLGPIVRYRDSSPSGRTVQDDITAWVATQPDIVMRWATEHPGVVQAWVNADDKHKDAVTEWSKSHPDAVAEWKKANPEGSEPKPADLAVAFFTGNSTEFQKSWPKLTDDATWSVPAVFFDMWRQAHPDARLEDVPADLVMASGSGLDPHITLAGARYQLDRVAAAWAAKTKRDPVDARRIIEQVLREKGTAPLSGWVGVPLVNVLEVNTELKARMESSGRRSSH
jgi:K+-transporting ATPase ATPase C chain